MNKKEQATCLATLKKVLAHQDIFIRSIENSKLVALWEWEVETDEFNPSKELLNFLGIQSQKEVNTGKKWSSYIHEHDQAKAFAHLDQLVSNKTKDVRFDEIRYRHANGHIVHLMTTAQLALQKSTDRSLKLVGAHLNITDLTEVRQALRKQINKYHLTIAGIQAGIWSWDIPNNHIWWSPRFYELLGYRNQEIEPSQEAFNAFIHPDDINAIQNGLQHVLPTGKPYADEVRMQHKNGQYFWFSLSGKAQLNGKSELVAMAGSLINIHEKKQQELQLKRNEFLLSEASKVAKMGIWELNLITEELFWSDMVYHIHELPTSYQPKYDTAIDFYPEPYRALLKAKIARTIAEKVNYEEDLQIKTATQKLIWVKVKGYPVLNSKQEVVGLRGVIQDISSHKHREYTLHETVDHLNHKNSLLENFNHMVSHNLKSHSGNIETLMNMYQEYEDPDMKEEIFNNLENVSQHLKTTVMHLNNMLRIKHGEESRELIGVNACLKAIIDSVDLSVSNHAIDIQLDLPENLNVFAVPAYFESICLNLISNAIKYADPDKKAFLSINAGSDKQYTYLYFEDNGLGMDLKKVGKQLFSMYKTFHNHPDAEGIGLFMVKNQLKSMGGDIAVESEPKKGTTFKFWLPKP